MLSPFQQDYARSIEASPDFEQWCVDPDTMARTPNIPNVPRFAQLFCYYTKDWTLHLDRLSDTEVLATFTFPTTEFANAESQKQNQIESGQAV